MFPYEKKIIILKMLSLRRRSSSPGPDPNPLLHQIDANLPVLRIRIRNPGLGAFLTPGSGIRDGRKSASGSGIRDEQPGSYFLELRNHFFAFLGLKYLNSLMRIRDPGWRQFGSGIRDKKKVGSGIRVNIPDPPH
jgi:hypothetical protein